MGILSRIFGNFSENDINAARDRADVRLLTRAVRNRNASICVAAVDALGHLNDAEAIQVLVKALCHDQADVRSAAVRSLQHQKWSPKKGGERVSWLIACNDHQSLCQLSVEELLSEMREATESYFIIWSVAVLTALKNASAATGDSLLEILTFSELSPAMRGIAAIALTIRKDERAVKPLLEIYSSDKEEEMFDSVGIALQLFSELDSVANSIIEVMLHKLEGKHCGSAARILAYMGKRIVKILSKKSFTSAKNKMPKAMAALSLVGTGMLSELRTFAQYESSEVQSYVDTFFRIIEGKHLTQRYYELYNYWSADEGIRVVAAVALGNLRDPEAIDFLAKLARGDGNDTVRHEAVFSLGKMIDYANAKEILLNSVHNKKWRTGERFGALIILLWRGIAVPLEPS